MQASSTQHPGPEMLSALKEAAGGAGGVLPLDGFINTALYHPLYGYYCRPQKRVGRSGEADFYTASSLGPVFSRLVVEAIRQLAPQPLETLTFVEAGPESSAGILGSLDSSPFRDCLLIRPGEAFNLPGPCILFSNELFDAQPFRRFVFRDDGWSELGVRIGDNALEWTEITPLSPLPQLPETAPSGYVVDWPSGAHALLRAICQQPWKGLFIAFDYGITRQAAFRERPEGTGRTYHRHRLDANLLTDPGNRDITCHLIWDEMEDILGRHGFEDIRLQRQETFFVHHAGPAIEDILTAGATTLSRDKQTLMELLHPGHMGHKFQVLSARRS